MTTPLIVCSGSPFERGREHGERACDLVATGVSRWRQTLAGVADGDVDAYLDRFIADTDFFMAIERWTPDLLEEVAGLATGAGLDRTTALAYQFMDEQWCYEHRKAKASSEMHHCSSLSIARSGGGRIVAQNMDLPVNFDTTQVVVKTDDELLFTAAGLIVTTGMNAAGVGVCVNSILDRPTAPEGLPVAFVIRGILAHQTARDAADFVREIPHASGQNYVISDSSEAFDLEASAGGVDEYTPGSTILHTNHSLTIDTDGAELSLGFSQARLQVLVDAFGGRDDATEDEIKDVLRDRTAPVCRLRHPDSEWMTFGSVVMTLDDDPRMALAPGPPTEAEYETYRV